MGPLAMLSPEFALRLVDERSQRAVLVLERLVGSRAVARASRLALEVWRLEPFVVFLCDRSDPKGWASVGATEQSDTWGS